MIALMHRLRNTKHADRWTDAAIYASVLGKGWKVQTDCPPFPDEVQSGRVQEVGGWAWMQAPAYTFSIDAAMKLIPDGYAAVFHLFNHRDGFWECDLGRDGPTYRGQAATPALAICIAALDAVDHIGVHDEKAK